MKPVFVLCVGAQKSGTTWLHNVLHRQSYANFGFDKEYHIWDARFLPMCSKFKATTAFGEDAKRGLRRLMQTESGVYCAYFQSLVSEQHRMTGDFTPSYSMLRAEQFAHIKELIEGAGFSLKVVFIMRDPVERHWSAVRMRKRRLDKQKVFHSDEYYYEEFLSSASDPQYFERGSYHRTVPILEEVFERSQLHFEFYEQLFNDDAMQRLSSFLGYKIEDVDFAGRTNASTPVDLPSELVDSGRSLFNEVYQFCAHKFPITKELWGGGEPTEARRGAIVQENAR